MSCVNISVEGVIKPAINKIATKAIFRCFLRNAVVNKPIFDKKYTNTGNSNTKPIEKERTEIVDI